MEADLVDMEIAFTAVAWAEVIKYSFFLRRYYLIKNSPAGYGGYQGGYGGMKIWKSYSLISSTNYQFLLKGYRPSYGGGYGGLGGGNNFLNFPLLRGSFKRFFFTGYGGYGGGYYGSGYYKK